MEGSVGEPTLQLTLSGEGRASGSLTGSAHLASGSLDLRSNLALDRVATDLAISRQGGEVRMRGSVDLGPGGFSSAPGASGANRFRGERLFEGWSLVLGDDLLVARIAGDLGSLSTALSGLVDFELSLPDERGEWLAGRVEGASLSGLEIGSASILATADRAVVAGDRLEGAVDVQELTWTLERMSIDLPGNLAAELSGSGSTSEGTLGATVTGGPDERTELPIEAHLSLDRLAFVGRGPILDGTAVIDLQATRADGWSGRIDLSDVAVGAGRLSAGGRLQGPFERPELASDLSLAFGGFSLDGTARAVLDQASLASLHFDQQLSGRGLETVTLRGEVAPDRNVVTLSTGGLDALVLETPALSLSAPIAASGRAEISVGPAATVLRATPEGGLSVTVELASLQGLAAEAEISSAALGELIDLVRDEGLSFRGASRSSGAGTLFLANEPSISLEGFAYRGDVFSGTVSGAVSVGLDSDWDVAGAVHGALEFSPTLPWIPAVLAGTAMPFSADADGGTIRVGAEGPLGSVEIRHDARTGEGTLAGDLVWQDGGLETEMRYGSEAQGALTIRNLAWGQTGIVPAFALDAAVEVSGGAVEGSATARTEQGDIRATGRWGLSGWVPSVLAGEASEVRDLDVRISGVQPARLPAIAETVPNLTGEVNGIVQVPRQSLRWAARGPRPVGPRHRAAQPYRVRRRP